VALSRLVTFATLRRSVITLGQYRYLGASSMRSGG
jgi:hypothetical protein